MARRVWISGAFDSDEKHPPREHEGASHREELVRVGCSISSEYSNNGSFLCVHLASLISLEAFPGARRVFPGAT